MDTDIWKPGFINSGQNDLCELKKAVWITFYKIKYLEYPMHRGTEPELDQSKGRLPAHSPTGRKLKSSVQMNWTEVKMLQSIL